MAELKTQKNKMSVEAFIKKTDPKRREDAETVLEMMKRITGEPPAMWGASIVGFGSYHYKYPSGREGDWFITGFSPRKQNLTLYIMPGFIQYGSLMKKLGKYKTGKSCLYINKLADIDLPTLEKLVEGSVKHMRASYPEGK